MLLPYLIYYKYKLFNIIALEVCIVNDNKYLRYNMGSKLLI